MAVKIRLKRMGKIRAPYYRVVIADSRTKRDGRAIEEIGKYHPTEEPSVIDIKSDRVQYWLGVGAQPTEQVMALLKVTGDWQTFKGLPGGEGTLRFAPPKPDRKALYEAAMLDVSGEPTREATTPRARRPKADPPSAAAAAAPASPAPVATTAAPVAETVATEAPAVETVAVEAATVETVAVEAATVETVAVEAATVETPAADVAEATQPTPEAGSGETEQA